MKTTKRTTGDLGERAVIRYLKRRFYSIIQCNFESRWGELDIVAKRGRYLCFIEVKTRGENSLGRPADAVDRHKQSKIIKTAYYFLRQNSDFCDCMSRFDVAEVYVDNKKTKINYIKNAFDLNEDNFYR